MPFSVSSLAIADPVLDKVWRNVLNARSAVSHEQISATGLRDAALTLGSMLLSCAREPGSGGTAGGAWSRGAEIALGGAGIFLFVLGTWHQNRCHRILARLRKGSGPGARNPTTLNRRAATPSNLSITLEASVVDHIYQGEHESVLGCPGSHARGLQDSTRRLVRDCDVRTLLGATGKACARQLSSSAPGTPRPHTYQQNGRALAGSALQAEIVLYAGLCVFVPDRTYKVGQSPSCVLQVFRRRSARTRAGDSWLLVFSGGNRF